MYFAKKKKKKGFTLIELLVVIAIIGILATIVVVNVNSARQKAKVAVIIGSMDSLRSAAEMAYDSTGSYASTCASSVLGTSADFARIKTAVVAQGGAISCYSGSATPDSYSAWASTTNTGEFYCVDSTGNAKKVTTAPTTASCGN